VTKEREGMCVVLLLFSEMSGNEVGKMWELLNKFVSNCKVSYEVKIGTVNKTSFVLCSTKLLCFLSIDSKGFWWYSVTHIVTGFLVFVYCLVFQAEQHNMSETGPVLQLGMCLSVSWPEDGNRSSFRNAVSCWE
jgi:hypothetical protein